jgi:dethiobiotin synthetase
VPEPTLVVVCSTATEVGKTHVACELARTARARGLRVAARKPAQAFDPDDDGPTDAELLAAATGEDPEVVCPPDRWYPVPMAPPIAAAALERARFTLADLLVELRWHGRADLRLVETAGGVRSPLADDGDGAALCSLLAPDAVVLVADAALGAINAVRLSVDALAGQRVVVHLNRFDSTVDTHQRNLAWLTERDGLSVTTAVTTLADRLGVGGAP